MNLDNFIIDKITGFKMEFKCENCGEGCDFDKSGERPHYCPHCHFDFWKADEEEKEKREKYIEDNPNCQLSYDIIGADLNYGIKCHPCDQMRNLGYKILDGVPQSISDCWWFTVDKFIEPLPGYLKKMRYTIGEC